MTKEQIKELNQIRKKLIEVKSHWEQETINERMNDVNKLFNIVENQNFNEFLNLRYNSYLFLDDDKLRAIINKHTDWLSSREKVKQIIVSGSRFYKIVDNDVFNDISMWIEILKENEIGFVDKLNIDLDHIFNFNVALSNKELLELSFNKLWNLYSLFYPIDFTKLEPKYFNNEKYIKLILNSTNDVKAIKLLNKDVIFKDKDIWFFHGDKIIDAYGAEIVKYVDKSLWLNREYYLKKLIQLDVNIFNDYYDDIIKDNDLTKVAIDANYNVIKYIKNNDFNDEIKDIIVNKLQALESEIYD